LHELLPESALPEQLRGCRPDAAPPRSGIQDEEPVSRLRRGVVEDDTV
jgi:hypothetical protein